MSWLIKPLPDNPDFKRTYVLDSNIWFFILVNSLDEPRPEEEKYRNFLYKFGKKCVKQGPIVKLPCFIFSEVLNRILRGIFYPKFKDKVNWSDPKYNYIEPNHRYKKVYKASSEYIDDYKKVISDFKAFEVFYDFQNDGIESILDKANLDDVVKTKLDFADYLLVKFAKNNDYVLVTDDSDFLVEDVEILTLNAKLISAAKARIKN